MCNAGRSSNAPIKPSDVIAASGAKCIVSGVNSFTANLNYAFIYDAHTLTQQ